MFKILSKVFGTENDRKIKKILFEVEKINSLESSFREKTTEELANMTNILKKNFSQNFDTKEILYKSFATIREVSKRILNQRHFDSQIIGGIVLNSSSIAEMQTGEGKTLAATLPAYFNAILGSKVHIVTVNDYLAVRDSSNMQKIFEFLGIKTGCIVNNSSPEERKLAYNSDILYATNNELGFDYLKDNMRYFTENKIQSNLDYAIIDEVDSILIDEARTPLIISGPVEEKLHLYNKINNVISLLENKDYEIDFKAKTVHITDLGINHIDQILVEKKIISPASSIYDVENIFLMNYLNQSLKAQHLFKKDVDYLVKEGKALIIDEFTGRVLEGRRYSEGLHQAIEAKEKIQIQNESQTLASITLQNYFRLYKKLSGMTGTAMTEATELKDIYNLNVLSIPTNKKNIRKDTEDQIYGTLEEKYEAIIKKIQELYQKGQPVLVGTISIEKSEILSRKLKKLKIRHNVLNAKKHEKEAYIIAQAGRYKSVTISTNMAGRGTDIMLGGNPEMMLNENSSLSEEDFYKKFAEEKQKILEQGGLYVIGTERHETRRIDNQLRGRSGRQGDPGETKFFLSLEDDLVKIFAPKTITSVLRKMGLKNGEAIDHPLISRSIEKAQRKVESNYYEIRKLLLKFDDVINDQRKIFYEQREDVIEADKMEEFISNLAEQLIIKVKQNFIKGEFKEEWLVDPFIEKISNILNQKINKEEFLDFCNSQEDVPKYFISLIVSSYKNRRELYPENFLEKANKYILLNILDNLWKDHLYTIDQLRQGISLRAYGQKDPLSEYKFEAYKLFENFMNKIPDLFIHQISHIKIDSKSKSLGKNEESTSKNSTEKISRNQLCPCGSQKKYKHCHGKFI
ncbi:MAG: preprotein translocase subunit SecA [Rickettsia sp.]|nr:preprotein translocase subunit SecA [Rickettsia sp.]